MLRDRAGTLGEFVKIAVLLSTLTLATGCAHSTAKPEPLASPAESPTAAPAVASAEAEAAASEPAAMDGAALAKFIKSRFPALKDCYLKSLKLNPQLEGKVVVRFQVHSDGTLSDVVARSGPSMQDAATCIVESMRVWTTPFRPVGPVSVEYPFVLHPVR